MDEETLKRQICPRRVEEQPYADLKRSAPPGKPREGGAFSRTAARRGDRDEKT